MTKPIIYILITLMSYPMFCQVKVAEFDFGYPNQDILYDATLTKEGNFVLVGSGNQDTTTTGANPAIIFLNPSFDTVQTHNYKNFYCGPIVGIRQGIDGNLKCLTGSQNNCDAFLSNSAIAEFGPLGNFHWVREYNTNTEENTSDFLILPDGGAIFTGDRGNYGTGAVYPYAIRVDRFGNEIWNKEFQSLGATNKAKSISPKRDGAFILSGRNGVSNDHKIYEIVIDANGNTLSHSRVLTDIPDDENWGTAVIETSDTGYLFAGYNKEGFNTIQFILKTDSNFNQEWYSSAPNGRGLYEVENHQYVTIGQSGSDQVISKLDTGGNLLSSLSFKHNDGHFVSTKLILDGIGGGIAVGHVDNDPSVFELDFYWAKFDSIGVPVNFNEGCTPPGINWVSSFWQNDTVFLYGSHEDSAHLKHNKEVYTWWFLQDGRIIYGDSLYMNFDQEMWPDTFWAAMVTLDGIYCSDTMVINVYNNDILPNYVGIKEEIQSKSRINDELIIYPNPAKNEFKVLYPDSKTLANSTIEIYDGTGRKMLGISQRYSGNEIAVNCHNLPKGIYFVLLKTEQGLIGKGKVNVGH